MLHCIERRDNDIVHIFDNACFLERASGSDGFRSLALRLIAQVPTVDLREMHPFLFKASASEEPRGRPTTYALRLEHALARLQPRRVLDPPAPHGLAAVPAVLRDDPVPHDPRRERDVDERELLPEEVRPFDLPAERPERLVELLEERALLLRALRLDEAHVRGDDLLVDVVRPEADQRAVERVCREEVRRGRGEGVLEELADDEGLVQSAAFVLDRGDEAFRVDRCGGSMIMMRRAADAGGETRSGVGTYLPRK